MADTLAAAIAERLVARGVPWHHVHCPGCGEPLPGHAHVCTTTERPCTGLASVLASVADVARHGHGHLGTVEAMSTARPQQQPPA